MATRKCCLIIIGVCLVCMISGIAYSQSVGVAWVAKYNGPANNLDVANALAIDETGNVYVTGGSIETSLFDFAFATIKYSPFGDTLWVRRYNGPVNDWDEAHALKVDASGNVYVTGKSVGSGTSFDYATIKYAPSGDTAWVRRYNGPANSLDEANGLAVDDSSNIYVTGSSGGSGEDYATLKYKPNGDTAWMRRFHGSVSDRASALVIDDSGNVYVTGGSWDTTYPPYYDILTIKYSPSGDTLWLRIFDAQIAFSEFGSFPYYVLAVDKSGNVYVSGNSDGDYFTVKYAPNGDVVWFKPYPGSFATALAVDDGGNVYVTGSSPTIKYLPNGDTAWVSSYSGNALTLDHSGNVYITGYSATVKILPDGDTGWVRSEDMWGYALAVDDSGNVYVTGSALDSSGTSWDYATIKYSPCSATPGDVNGTPPIALPDVIHLANYIFDKDRPATSCLGSDTGNCWTPDPLCLGEVDGNAPISLPDVIWLVNFVFDKDRPGLSCLGTGSIPCWLPIPTDVCCKLP
jgi:hypothetical protein